MTMPDYRFEFRGQIERKALGWIFRASNPKNYYVMKLEIDQTRNKSLGSAREVCRDRWQGNYPHTGDFAQ